MRRGRILPARVGFWFSGPCLLVALLTEAVTTLFHGFFFFFHRRATRERMVRLILEGGTSPRPGLAGSALSKALPALLAVAALLLVSGCTHFPGASFNDQIRNLTWTTRELFFSEHVVNDNLAVVCKDLKTILAGPKYEDLTAKEFIHTFEMLGW